MARLQIGCEFFREIREKDLCYVDKTRFIEEFLTSSLIKLSLITRPRRFGKTLMLTMLRDFFDIRQDSKALFEGLAISKNRALCDKWMNQYPTVFITFKRTGWQSFEDALEKIQSRISDICKENAFLLDSPSVDEADREALRTLKAKKGDKVLLYDSLKILCRALHAHYGRPVILLIDEYDVPLARAQENGYYPDMAEFMRDMLEEALKTSQSVQFAILAGCLRISKESIFTGIDNIRFFDVSEPIGADKIGFTQKEVDDLLAAAEISVARDKIKERYEGYHFGDDTVLYCPWDILEYACDLQANPAAEPKNYWGNTSGNDVVHRIVAHSDLYDVRSKLDTLMRGACIPARISENLTHACMYENADNMWTVLYFSGYLTKANPIQLRKCGVQAGAEVTGLAIPNKEVLEIFADAISDWFEDAVQDIDRTEIFKALWSDDAGALADLLCGQLDGTITWYDAREDYYHDFVKDMFTCTSWDYESDKWSCNRPDLVLYDKKEKHAAIIEIRRATSENDLPGKAEEAILQIRTNRYAAPLIRKKGWKVSLWGMAFFQKTCMIRVEEGTLQP